MALKYFLPSYRLSFYSLHMLFHKEKQNFCIKSKTSLPSLRSQQFSVYFSKSFIILHFTFKSLSILINFYVRSEVQINVLFFLPMDIEYSTTICWKARLPSVNCFSTFLKHHSSMSIRVYFWSSTLFHWVLCQYHTSLITIPIYLALLLGRVIPPTLLFYAMTALTIIFAVHINFRISLLEFCHELYQTYRSIWGKRTSLLC